MVLRLIEEGQPLDEVVFYDTGMEFRAIYNNRDKMKRLLEEQNITFTEMKPRNSFLWSMLEKPIKTRDGSIKVGFGWCGGPCRWGTGEKRDVMNRYIRSQNAEMYIGIAADEQYRLQRKLNRESGRIYPLVQWGMTESDCLAYCRKHGWNWKEGDTDLYDVLDRVSCWCCRNKNRKELYAIWKHLPEYWGRLKDLESKIGEPMKRFHNRQYGDYGSLADMERIFQSESECEQLTLF